MKIAIDGHPIDFTLERERTFADVYRELEAWLAGRGRRISGLSVDGREVDPENREQVMGRRIDAVASVDLRTRSERETAHHELSVILDYFSLLERALAEDPAAAIPILGEYPYIRQGLFRRLGDSLFPDEGGIVREDELLTRLTEGQSPLGPEERKTLGAFSREIMRSAAERIREISETRSETAALIRLLEETKPLLENVPVLLQTGKDREAMRNLMGYTELALKATRLLSLHPSDSPGETDAFCRELNEALRELTEAFRTQDSVLLGDILEYEIASRIDGLTGLLAAILREGGPS